MPSYKSLAILALAASSVSPVLSAPLRQMRSRAELEERINMKLMERLGTNFALRAAPAFSTTEAHESRAIAELEDRAPSLLMAAGIGFLGKQYLDDHYQKKPDPSQTSTSTAPPANTNAPPSNTYAPTTADTAPAQR